MVDKPLRPAFWGGCTLGGVGWWAITTSIQVNKTQRKEGALGSKASTNGWILQVFFKRISPRKKPSYFPFYWLLNVYVNIYIYIQHMIHQLTSRTSRWKTIWGFTMQQSNPITSTTPREFPTPNHPTDQRKVGATLSCFLQDAFSLHCINDSDPQVVIMSKAMRFGLVKTMKSTYT